MMTMGVLAATSHTLGVSTTVSFTASYIGGSITGNVTGVTGATQYATQTFDETTTSTLAPWNVGQNLVVQDTNAQLEHGEDAVLQLIFVDETFYAISVSFTDRSGASIDVIYDLQADWHNAGGTVTISYSSLGIYDYITMIVSYERIGQPS